MSYTDVAEEVVKLASKEGARQAIKFTDKRRKSYLAHFESLRDEINAQYQISSTSIQQRYAEGKITKKLITERIKTYPSSKGDVADILPNEELERYNQIQEQLREARKSLYQFKENDKVIKLSMKLMNLVMMLKQDITNEAEEKFSFIYKGQDGVAYSIEVPLHNILLNDKLISYISIQTGDIQNWAGTDDQFLRFDSSIIGQMKNIINTTDNSSFSIRKMPDFMAKYDTAKESAKYLVSSRHRYGSNKFKQTIEDLIGNSENNRLDWYIRKDKQYYVIYRELKPGTGFLAQGLYGQEIGDPKATFRPDNNPWYGLADSTDKYGQSYSVKSFLEGDPSLVSLHSLHKITFEIIRILSSPLETDTIQSFLKQQIFQGGQILSQAFDQEVDKILTQYG